MKHLARLKRFLEIEIRRSDFHEFHLSLRITQMKTQIFICVTPSQSVAK